MTNSSSYAHSTILFLQALDLNFSSPPKMTLEFYLKRHIASSYDTKVTYKKTPNRTLTIKRKIINQKTIGEIGIKRYF